MTVALITSQLAEGAGLTQTNVDLAQTETISALPDRTVATLPANILPGIEEVKVGNHTISRAALGFLQMHLDGATFQQIVKGLAELVEYQQMTPMAATYTAQADFKTQQQVYRERGEELDILPQQLNKALNALLLGYDPYTPNPEWFAGWINAPSGTFPLGSRFNEVQHSEMVFGSFKDQFQIIQPSDLLELDVWKVFNAPIPPAALAAIQQVGRIGKLFDGLLVWGPDKSQFVSLQQHLPPQSLYVDPVVVGYISLSKTAKVSRWRREDEECFSSHSVLSFRITHWDLEQDLKFLIGEGGNG